MMDRRYMVKQWVNGIRDPRTGVLFRVFETGDPAYYLFTVLDENGCDGGIHFPVRKTDLTTTARRALRHGW